MMGKRVLITGVSSFVGNEFEKYVSNDFPDYRIDKISLKDESRKTLDLSVYDVILHVSGIAHRKETKADESLYFGVNRDLTIELAKQAKLAKVKQFVFMSSMSVYGLNTGVITSDTVPDPKTNYGRSKLQAEDGLRSLEDENFKVCILRSPMVYGYGCRGNFGSIVSFVNKFRVFPRVNNQRSLIYIDNLCAFIKKAMDNDLRGVFFPQNACYMNTSEMAEWIAEAEGKHIYQSRFLGLCAVLLSIFSKKAQKAFGSLIYRGLEEFDFDYCRIGAEESVKDSVHK